MRTHLLPKDGNLYKTNLHCHSTVSDGSFTPAQIKELYKSRGYHAVAFTDHQLCMPHPELTDAEFVALAGIEIAYGIGKSTSIHACGIARNPMTQLSHPNNPDNAISAVNAGIALLQEKGFITTLNHPRWSGISAGDLAAIRGYSNMEVVNGYEMVLDGYGDSSACYEAQLRDGKKVRPFAADDSHKICPDGAPGFEYFRGFTVIKAPTLSYDALIAGLDSGAFYASTGPLIHNLWLEDGILHLECSPVRGVYAHGEIYSHRAARVEGSDCMTCIDLDVRKICADSSYLFVQVANTRGEKAWASPLWLK